MDQLKSQVHLLICLPVPLHQGGQVTTRYGPEAQERRNGVGAGGGDLPEGSIFFFFFVMVRAFTESSILKLLHASKWGKGGY